MKNCLPQVVMALMVTLLASGITPMRSQVAASTAPQPTRFNRAPVSNEILQVHIPGAVKQILPNGIKVFVLENHRAAEININIYVNGAGGLFDPSGQPGVSSMTAEMLSRGTSTLSAKDIARATDTLGASIDVNSTSTSANASILASGLSSNFDQWLPVIADILLRPSFPTNELEDAKRRDLSGLQAQQSSPSFLASKYFRKALYGDTPEGIVSATPASTAAFTVDAIRSFYMQHYSPQNTIVIVTGDITPVKAFGSVSAALKSWKRTGFQATIPPVTSETMPRSITLVDRSDSVQTNLVLGRLAIDRRNPDYVPLAVANHIIGSPAAGRLFMRLREEKSYTYDARSILDAGDYRGVIMATSQVRPPVTGGALDEFFNEFQRLGGELVSTEELKRHEHAMVAGFAISLESPRSLMTYVYTQEHYGCPDDYWDRYAAQIATVSAEDVMRMGKKYYSEDHMQIVAVVDPAIKPALAKWGEVQEVIP